MSGFRPALIALTASATATVLALPTAAMASRPVEVPRPSPYVVVLRPAAAQALAPVLELAGRLGADVGHVYRHALTGFSATLPAALVPVLRANPAVAYLEPDRSVSLTRTQGQATTGLDRIDQRRLPLDRTYTYDATGAGVSAYVIDTGILLSHREFAGRAVTGFDAVTRSGTAVDCNGHGTHVAGTIGGATYGVAKAVRLVAVRVLDCEGSGATSGVIAGVDWVTANHRPGQPAVANMSLGGGTSRALDDAVDRSVADGVTYVVAAGNGDQLGRPQDACGSSPGRLASVLTVAASDAGDRAATFSNYGTCVDLYAPGVAITSAWSTSPTAVNTIDGTSMASPHVAGVAATVLQRSPRSTPQQVHDRIRAGATPDAVAGTRTSGGLLGLGGSSGPLENNRLLFSRL